MQSSAAAGLEGYGSQSCLPSLCTRLYAVGYEGTPSGRCTSYITPANTLVLIESGVTGSIQSHSRADLPGFVKLYRMSDAPDKNAETDRQQQKAGAADGRVRNIRRVLKQ